MSAVCLDVDETRIAPETRACPESGVSMPLTIRRWPPQLPKPRDRASGKDAKRPELEAMLAFVREGDVVVVHSMDRLARNLDDLRRSVQELTAKGVRFDLDHEHLSFTGQDAPMANLLLSVMGAFAEFERALIRIRERQLEGIEPGQAARRLPRAASFTRHGCAGAVISPCTRRGVEVSTSSGVRHQPTIRVSLPASRRGSAATVGELSHGHRISGHPARRRSSAK